MTSPAIQVASMLNDAAVGSTASGATEWPIKVGGFATEPYECIAIMDAPGARPNPKWLLDFPAFQVLVRVSAGGYDVGYDKAANIKDVLLGADVITVGDDRWDSITMMGDISYIGMDGNSCPMFSLNFRAIIERKANALTRREELPA